MKPLDDTTADINTLVLRALDNARQFDLVAHEQWLRTQPADIVACARRCPPDRLYQVMGWGAGATVYAVVTGYQAGSPACVVVTVLGTGQVLGAYPEALVDVVGQLGDHYGP